VIAPARMLGALGGDASAPIGRRTVRVLGGRQLVQAAAELFGGPVARTPAAVVDASHAVSCLGVAAVDRRWRRAALTDAVVAAGFVWSDLRFRRTRDPGEPDCRTPDLLFPRRRDELAVTARDHPDLRSSGSL